MLYEESALNGHIDSLTRDYEVDVYPVDNHLSEFYWNEVENEEIYLTDL